MAVEPEKGSRFRPWPLWWNACLVIERPRRRAQRRQRQRHRRPAPSAPVQGLHQLRQLRRRRDLDEDRPQQHRPQRPGGFRRREQPLRGAGGRHLPLRRDAALQDQRQRHGPHARAARAERHDRNPRLLRGDLRHPRLARHHDLAADHGPADGRRYRRAAGVFPGRGRLLRRRSHVLLGLQDWLGGARRI